MTNIYEAYQGYLQDIGEYVPSAYDVSNPTLTPTYTYDTGYAPPILDYADDGDDPGKKDPPGGITGVPGGITGVKGPGLTGIYDQYQDLGKLGKFGVNMGLNMVAPGLGSLLGLYGMADGFFGGPKGLNQIDAMNYAKNIDPDRYDGFNPGVGPTSFSTNPGIGFSNRDPEDTQDYGGGESSGGAGTGNSNASDPGGSDSMGSF